MGSTTTSPGSQRAIIAAPSNLGLRPPQPTAVPGTAKAPEALREAGLYRILGQRGATDVGVVVAGRYVDDADPRLDVLRNQEEIVAYTLRLAGRVTELVEQGSTPLVLGGDCSILLGPVLALKRRGRYGLRRSGT